MHIARRGRRRQSAAGKSDIVAKRFIDLLSFARQRGLVSRPTEIARQRCRRILGTLASVAYESRSRSYARPRVLCMHRVTKGNRLSFSWKITARQKKSISMF